MTLVAAAMVAVSASAQVYVGGSFGVGSHTFDYGHGDDKTVTTYKFMPEIGYNINEDWAVGAGFGWKGANEDFAKAVEVAPYVRWTPVHLKNLNVFIDGAFGYAHYYGGSVDLQAKAPCESDVVKHDEVSVGLRPGLALELDEHFSFEAHVGFLGWSQITYDNSDTKITSVGLNLDGNNLSFGVVYKF